MREAAMSALASDGEKRIAFCARKYRAPLGNLKPACRISVVISDRYHSSERVAAMDYYTTLAASVTTLSFVIAATVLMYR